MAQLPKGGLARCHDKPPIHGNCAIYFPGHVNDKEAVHFLLLKRQGAFGYVLLKHHFKKKEALFSGS